MSAIDIGRIVVKTMGREAGKRAVVTQLIDKNFVEISGPYELTSIKRRRVNIQHIEPTENKLDLTLKKNTDKDIIALIEGNADLKNALIA